MRYLVCFLMTVVVCTGCHTFNNKHTQAHIIQSARSNIATSNQISNHTTSILLSSGYTQAECMTQFNTCLDDVKQGFFADKPSRSLLALLAELHYAHATHIANQEACRVPIRPPIDPYYSNAPLSTLEQQRLQQNHQDCQQNYQNALQQTIKHSYAYLFYDALTNNPTAKGITHEDDIKTQDLYHVATNALIDHIYHEQKILINQVTSTKAHTYQQLHIDSHYSGDYQTNLYLDSDIYHQHHSSDNQEPILSDLISAYDGRMANLDTTSTRSGLGVGYVGVLADRRTFNIKNTLSTTNINDTLKTRIHPMGYVLLTAISKPQGDTLDTVLHGHQLDIYFFNPYNNDKITIARHDYPLFANFSAGYALWLGDNPLNQVGLLALFNKQTTALPELFMLEPYNPDKKVVIMLHGLASSPATWVNVTNNLLADPVLRKHYQVWQIFYSTNLPILENRYHIQQLIEQAYHTTDPSITQPASRNSILIGHSMGGVISRLMLSDDNLVPKLTTLSHNDNPNTTLQKPIKKLLLQVKHEQELNSRLHLKSLPQVDTAVFISAPFKGTDYADRWFTRLARRVIRLPLDLTQSVTDILDDIGEPNSQDSIVGSLYLQNGASQLSDRSAFMKLTADIHIKDGVRYYTIMGDQSSDNQANLPQGDAVGTALSDGIVPYTSSHLDGALREIIIKGGHSIHENPKTVRELRKILHEHLATTTQ